MENTSPNESSPLATFLANRDLKEANESTQEKVVLNDECGDSLWDAVLDQEDGALLEKDDAESNKSAKEANNIHKSDTVIPST